MKNDIRIEIGLPYILDGDTKVVPYAVDRDSLRAKVMPKWEADQGHRPSKDRGWVSFDRLTLSK